MGMCLVSYTTYLYVDGKMGMVLIDWDTNILLKHLRSI